MCGISAIFSFTSITNSDKRKLTLMNQEMHYRGPDESDVWADEVCGLAHTRLSIIGLDNGHQPLFNEDKSLVLICNGEIYNYVELREELKEAGHQFTTDSDCEVILHLYEDLGVECLLKLRGMFAFCLWNIRTRQLFVARDRVGEKTLYYAQIQTGFVFSTELKAIHKHFLGKSQLNIKSLAQCIRYNYPIDLKNTHIEQIKRIQAGEYALVDVNGMELHHYWKRDMTPRFTGTREEAKAEILRLMRESVRLCLRSDVPVAILLSGGIDSSAVAAFAKETGREVHVITAGYKGEHVSDERSIARQFAVEKGLIWHEVELDAADFKDVFYEYTQFIDEPISDIASIAQWALYKKAKELGFTVLLGGLGGDELFYGYPSWNQVAESLKISRKHKSLFPWKGKKLDFIVFILKNWKYVLYAGYPNKIDEQTIVPWTYEDYCRFVENAYLCYNHQIYLLNDVDVSARFDTTKPEIEAVYQHNFENFMGGMCLYLADRLGMGNAIEIRSPLIDYKLIEFVSSLSIEMKYDSKMAKSLLKETLEGIIPSNILYGKKQGFTPPISYINEIVAKSSYKYITSDFKFFNSILTDRVICNIYR